MNWTIKSILDATKDYFLTKDIETPRIDAEILLAYALNYKNRLNLYLDFDKLLTNSEVALFRDLVKKRIKRIPCQYIVQESAFFGVPFFVDNHVLIPRPETELLVEKCIRMINETGAQVGLDVGTGSGVICCSLKMQIPSLSIFGLDISLPAVHVAKKNFQNLMNINDSFFWQGDTLNAVKSLSLDFIISNPPYVTEEEWQELLPEVRDHEPKTALVAPEKGLYYYKLLLEQGKRVLKPGGWIFFEIGETMKKFLEDFLNKEKEYTNVYFEKDLNYKDRYLFLRLKN